MAEEEFMATIGEEAGVEERLEDVVYICAGCGKNYTYYDFMQSGVGLKCTRCGSRIFYKPRGIGKVKPRRIYAI